MLKIHEGDKGSGSRVRSELNQKGINVQLMCLMIRELQPLTAWVASEAARCDRCPAGEMVLLFAAVETAVKRIAFTVRQVSRGVSVYRTRACVVRATSREVSCTLFDSPQPKRVEGNFHWL